MKHTTPDIETTLTYISNVASTLNTNSHTKSLRKARRRALSLIARVIAPQDTRLANEMKKSIKQSTKKL